MNTPTTLIDKLKLEETVSTAIEVYKEAQQAVNEYEGVKAQARGLVRAYLTQTDQTREKLPAGAISLTKPTTTYRVNEEYWQAACRHTPGLAAVQQQFDAAQRALDAAQRAFLEVVTPEPTVYVR
jgi:putative IMPACT (imprinted ancient) family translation regulator